MSIKETVETYIKDEVLGGLNKPLSDTDLLKEPFKKAHRKKFDLGSGHSITPGAEIRIHLYNEKRDEDDLKILGPAPKGKPAALLKRETGSSWLRYSLEAGGTLKGKLEGFSLSADGEIGIHQYFPGANDQTLFQTVKKHTGRFGSPTSFNDVVGLKKGEALVLAWEGKMAAAVEIDWNSVVANAIQAISLPGHSAMVVTIDATLGATLSASASIQDSFLVGFTKSGQRIGVEVRKADRRKYSLGVTLGVKIQIRLTDEAKVALKKLETAILQQIVGASLKKVEELVGLQKRYDQLDIAQKNLADSLSKKFFGKPVNELTKGLEDLQKKAGKWLSDSRKQLVKSAEQTIEAGLALGYSRTQADELLMKTTVTADDLKPIHKKLIRGKMEAIQDSSLAGSSSYFLRKILESQAYTFTIGISFGSIGFSYSRKKEKSLIEESDREGKKKLTFTYDSSKLGKVGSETNNRALSIKGSMDTFKDASVLTPGDLDYSFRLAVGNVDKKVKDDEVIDYVDTARIWGCIPGDRNTLRNVIAKIPDGSAGDLMTSLECSPEVATQLLVWNPATDLDFLAKALSLSLMAYRKFDELRDLELRLKLYEQLFKTYLAFRGKKPGPNKREDLIKSWCRQLPDGKIKDAELAFRYPRVRRGRRNPGDIAHWKNYASGFLFESFDTKAVIVGMFKKLAALNSSGAKYSRKGTFANVIWNSYEEVDVIRKNIIQMRAVGTLLSLKASSLNLEKKFVIQVSENNKAKISAVPEKRN